MRKPALFLNILLKRICNFLKRTWVLYLVFILSVTALSNPEKKELLNREALISSLPCFQYHFNKYNPRTQYIEPLHSFGRITCVRVFFKSGCSQSTEYIPAFVKILEKADNPNIKSEYYRLPEDPSQWKTVFPEKDISKSPTFIVYVDNEEKGRIVEKPLNSLEEDLLDILSPSPPSEPSLDYDFFMNNYHADWDVNCSECHLPD